MSWNNVIPAEYIVDDPKMRRWTEPENPAVTLPLELVTDCRINYTFEGYHSVAAASADHPAFAELRRVLAARGYIKIPDYPCWNGDKVLKRFRFNDFQLEVKDTFYCASAWSNILNANKGL